VPQADGTLVPTPGMPSDDLLPSLLTTSDVLGTGWFAADAANVNDLFRSIPSFPTSSSILNAPEWA
jgi:hypothetical protein